MSVRNRSKIKQNSSLIKAKSWKLLDKINVYFQNGDNKIHTKNPSKKLLKSEKKHNKSSMSLKQPKKKLNNVSSLKRRTRPHTSKGRVYNYNVFPIRRIENSTKDYYMCNPYQLKTDEKYIDKYYMGIMKDIFKSEVKFMVNNL